MSYYKVRKITIEGQGMKVEAADSSIEPSHWVTGTYGSEDMCLVDKLRNFGKSVLSGDFHLQPGGVLIGNNAGIDYELEFGDIEKKFAEAVEHDDVSDFEKDLKYKLGMTAARNHILSGEIFVPMALGKKPDMAEAIRHIKRHAQEAAIEYEDAQLEFEAANKAYVNSAIRLDAVIKRPGKTPSACADFDLLATDEGKTLIAKREFYDNHGTLYGADKALDISGRYESGDAFDVIYRSDTYMAYPDEYTQGIKDLISALEETSKKAYATGKGYDKICPEIQEMIEDISAITKDHGIDTADEINIDEDDINL
ncbi:MAG: hypothetical protein K6B74_13885 [Ruminococcus sp.]|nr:hypothetical protein [Ruminococcus sp.]